MAEKSTTIGFVGLGHMGGNMAARFLAAGYRVYGESRSRERAQELVDAGLRWCTTPGEVAQSAHVLFTSLPDDRILQDVASGPGGILAGLTIMVGGAADAYRRVEPLLRELGTPTHVGTNGQGLVLKLAINISLAVQMLAFAEGLLLADREGVDRDIALDVMTMSPIGSPMLKTRAPLVLDLPEDAWFDIGLMHKDIRLALAAARGAAGSPPPARPAPAG